MTQHVIMLWKNVLSSHFSLCKVRHLLLSITAALANHACLRALVCAPYTLNLSGMHEWLVDRLMALVNVQLHLYLRKIGEHFFKIVSCQLK